MAECRKDLARHPENAKAIDCMLASSGPMTVERMGECAKLGAPLVDDPQSPGHGGQLLDFRPRGVGKHEILVFAMDRVDGPTGRRDAN